MENLNVKLSNLSNSKVWLLNSISDFLQSILGSKEAVIVTVQDKDVVKINFGDTVVIEIIDGLVYPHIYTINIKATERVTLGRMTDALQFIVSEIESVKEQINEK